MSERYEHIKPEGCRIVGPGEVLCVERTSDLALVLGNPNQSAMVVEGSREELLSWVRAIVDQLVVTTRDVRHLRHGDEVWLADWQGDRMQVTVDRVVPHPEKADWVLVCGTTEHGSFVRRPVPSAGSVPVVYEP